MLKSKKKLEFIAVLLTISILLCTGCGFVTENGKMLPISDKTEPKAYSTATVDDDFIDNQVLVVMQPNASHLRYGKTDFKEVECKKVLTLTDDYYIEKGANKALVLTLKGHSKQNVIAAVKALEQREDVLLAEPAYKGTFVESPRADETTEENSASRYMDRIYYIYNEEKHMLDEEFAIGIQPYAVANKYTIEDFAYAGGAEITSDITHSNGERFIRIRVQDYTQANVLRALRILAQREDVMVAEPHYIMGPDAAMSVTSNTATETGQWINNKISLAEAWALTTGTNTVTVGIIDSGIDITHPDLVGHVNTSLSRNYTNVYSAYDDDEGQYKGQQI